MSLGEYCAIASAGGMQIEDAILAVRKRGILMQNAVPDGKGAMGCGTWLDAKRLKPQSLELRSRVLQTITARGRL